MIGALAAGTNSSLVPAIIGAIASIAAALIAGAIALRASSYQRLLEDIKKIVESSADETAKRIKRAISHTLGKPPGRRWYDHIETGDDDDDD